MVFERKLITPDVAREILKNNVCNRKLNMRVVDAYAKMMIEGRWETDNPEGCSIVLGKNGVLKDGQHRLYAIIKSGVSIFMIVFVCEDTVTHFDEQKNRSATDFLTMSGLEISTSATSTSTLVINIKDGYRNEKCKKIDRDRLRDFVRDNKEDLILCDEIVTSKSHRPFCRKQGISAAIYFAIKYGEDTEKLRRFCSTVNKGIYSGFGDNTALIFRKHISEASKISPYEMEAITETYLWNYCSGDESERKKSRFFRYYFDAVSSNNERRF